MSLHSTHIIEHESTGLYNVPSTNGNISCPSLIVQTLRKTNQTLQVRMSIGWMDEIGDLEDLNTRNNAVEDPSPPTWTALSGATREITDEFEMDGDMFLLGGLSQAEEDMRWADQKLEQVIECRNAGIGWHNTIGTLNAAEQAQYKPFMADLEHWVWTVSLFISQLDLKSKVDIARNESLCFEINYTLLRYGDFKAVAIAMNILSDNDLGRLAKASP